MQIDSTYSETECIDRPIGPRVVIACFVATTGISAAGAILLGPKTAGGCVLILGLVFIAISSVLDHVRPLSFENAEVSDD